MLLKLLYRLFLLHRPIEARTSITLQDSSTLLGRQYFSTPTRSKRIFGCNYPSSSLLQQAFVRCCNQKLLSVFPPSPEHPLPSPLPPRQHPLNDLPCISEAQEIILKAIMDIVEECWLSTEHTVLIAYVSATWKPSSL
jgi:hypothetical protein